MVASTKALLVLVLASIVCSSTHANWYGKRGDKADFLSLLMQHRMDSLTSRDINAEVALAAIDQIIQMFRQRRSEDSIAAEIKQGA